MTWQRTDNRQPDTLRPHSFQLDFTKTPLASVLTTSGNTTVLCTASVEEGVPPFLRDSGQGWLTAEYRMLPGATSPRHRRELTKLSGRTQEIQRLIGRSLRAAIDLKLLGERTITIDADVLQADAGTRTASITGGYVALAHAIDKLIQKGEVAQSPLVESIAAISVGLIKGEAYLDLDYPEDVAADVDFNVVMNSKLELIEVQGTAEAGSFSRQQMNQMLDLAEKGITELITAQKQVCKK
ncbi:Ribonuclease PH [Hyella patelloides LEGE 07179]|uniref:Ribonuclease PH n=1 Tax=Hyella patelloides LEGE 07179 TaxID=945734 RepID=A0A563VNR7_9CYAN|nr:ribonuclease PH [Hyella patelloides]VEP12925.1 Ribonuclease PH [Hyella patelloides LEGE 07179]